MLKQSNPFSDGARFAANPYLYGYVHTLEFDPLGTVEFVDGAGQVLNTLVHGRFRVEPLTPSAFLLHFTDLVELNPYYEFERFRGLDLDAYVKATAGKVPYVEHDVLRRVDPYEVQVTREEGLFVFRQQVLWKISDEHEWPYLLSRVRYTFASDPLAAYVLNRKRNL